MEKVFYAFIMRQKIEKMNETQKHKEFNLSFRFPKGKQHRHTNTKVRWMRLTSLIFQPRSCLFSFYSRRELCDKRLLMIRNSTWKYFHLFFHILQWVGIIIWDTCHKIFHHLSIITTTHSRRVLEMIFNMLRYVAPTLREYKFLKMGVGRKKKKKKYRDSWD